MCLVAAYTGVSRSTVSRVLQRAGMSKLTDLSPKEDVQRYEHDAPGELLHIDIKKLGRFDKVGHRITGDRTQRARDIGWDYVFVAVDDHSRVAFTQVYPDETKQSAVSFLRATVSLGARQQPALLAGIGGAAIRQERVVERDGCDGTVTIDCDVSERLLASCLADDDEVDEARRVVLWVESQLVLRMARLDPRAWGRSRAP